MEREVESMARLSMGTMRVLMCLTAIILICAGPLSAKSLYLIADGTQNPTPIQAFNMQSAPVYLAAQTEQRVPLRGSGGVGLAIDAPNNKLLLAYEGSNQIQLLDAASLADLGTITAAGMSNPASLVLDTTQGRIYLMERQTNRLYVYDWIGAGNGLTAIAGSPFLLPNITGGYGIALDERRGRLYVTDSASTTVSYFSTASFQLLGSFLLLQSQQGPAEIAVDSLRNMVYTGNGQSGNGLLVKYDLNTNTETSYALPQVPGSAGQDQIAGLAVDEDNGYVYASIGNPSGGGSGTLMVFDSSLNVLKADFPRSGKPMAVVIPRTLNAATDSTVTTTVAGTTTTTSTTYSTTTTLPGGTALFYLDCPTNVAPGSQVVIPIRMATGLNAQVASFQIDLQFNRMQLTYLGVTKGASTIAAGKDIMVEAGNPGIVRFLVQGGNQTVLGDGVIMNVTFQIDSALPGGSSLPVICANLYVSNVQGALIPATCAGSGCNVVIVTKCGCDVSGDGQILVNDSQLLINMVLGAAPATCDVNGDGAIDIKDIQIVVNAILDPQHRCLN